MSATSYSAFFTGLPAAGQQLSEVRARDIPLATLYALTIAGFTLAGLLPTWFGLDSRAITVPYRAFVLSLAGLIIARWVLMRRPPVLNSFFVWIAFAWLLILLRMLYDFNFQPMPLTLGPAEYLVIAAGVCIAPMIAVFERPSDVTLRIAWTLATIGCAIGLAGVVALVMREGLIGVWTQRLSTDVLNPISLGHVGATLCLLSLAMPVELRARTLLRRSLQIGLRVLLVVMGMAVLLGTGSRGSMVALALAVGTLIVVRPGDHSLVPAILRSIAMMVVLVPIGVAAFLVFESVEALPSLARLAEFNDASSLHRIRLLTGAISQFAKNPFLGDALVVRTERDYPHNPLVESLMALGLPGFIVVSGVVFGALRAAVNVLMFQPQAAWLALVALQYIVAAMFSGSLYLSDSFWVFCVAVVTVANRPQLTRALPILDRP